MANIGGLPNNFVNETTKALKKRKREENLKNVKWEAVIIIDDADDKKEVVETENNAKVKEEPVTVDILNQHRSKKHHIKISARNRLFRVFDEEEDEDEGEIKKPWELDDEVANEDETDEENEVDDEDEWP
nr:hypothetical protein [Tanacetum cinerariifolium]